MQTVSEIKKDAESRMTKSVNSLKGELEKVRTGRANAALLDHITVDYYGTPTAINQVASVKASDARTLSVVPWEKNMVAAIEKAIIESNMGFNPAVAGTDIRIPIPPLSEERRKELAKVVRGEGENAKIAIRNIRRDSNQHLKDLEKNKEISTDDDKRGQDDIQKLTNRFISEVDKHIEEKEKSLMLI